MLLLLLLLPLLVLLLRLRLMLLLMMLMLLLLMLLLLMLLLLLVTQTGQTLRREAVKITSVQSYVGETSGVSGKVGVVRIKNFLGTTAETLRAELEGPKKKGAGTNFVLDLRGNPGGLLPGGGGGHGLAVAREEQ